MRFALWVIWSMVLLSVAYGMNITEDGEEVEDVRVVSYQVSGGMVVGTPTPGFTPKPGGPPGEDRDPPGVRIYERLADVPSARLLARAGKKLVCYPTRGCWRPFVCGHRCEQILLAVDGFCKKTGQCDECGEWKRCKKARKFHRCFPRVCYRGLPGARGKPRAYEDFERVSIVRYRRPKARYEILAMRKRQTSIQSAIFK